MNLNPLSEDLGSVLRTLTAAWPSVLRDPWYRLFAREILFLVLKTAMSRKLRQAEKKSIVCIVHVLYEVHTQLPVSVLNVSTSFFD